MKRVRPINTKMPGKQHFIKNFENRAAVWLEWAPEIQNRVALCYRIGSVHFGIDWWADLEQCWQCVSVGAPGIVCVWHCSDDGELQFCAVCGILRTACVAGWLSVPAGIYISTPKTHRDTIQPPLQISPPSETKQYWSAYKTIIQVPLQSHSCYKSCFYLSEDLK